IARFLDGGAAAGSRRLRLGGWMELRLDGSEAGGAIVLRGVSAVAGAAGEPRAGLLRGLALLPVGEPLRRARGVRRVDGPEGAALEADCGAGWTRLFGEARAGALSLE